MFTTTQTRSISVTAKKHKRNKDGNFKKEKKKTKIESKICKECVSLIKALCHVSGVKPQEQGQKAPKVKHCMNYRISQKRILGLGKLSRYRNLIVQYNNRIESVY